MKTTTVLFLGVFLGALCVQGKRVSTLTLEALQWDGTLPEYVRDHDCTFKCNGVDHSKNSTCWGKAEYKCEFSHEGFDGQIMAECDGVSKSGHRNGHFGALCEGLYVGIITHTREDGATLVKVRACGGTGVMMAGHGQDHESSSTLELPPLISAVVGDDTNETSMHRVSFCHGRSFMFGGIKHGSGSFDATSLLPELYAGVGGTESTYSARRLLQSINSNTWYGSVPVVVPYGDSSVSDGECAATCNGKSACPATYWPCRGNFTVACCGSKQEHAQHDTAAEAAFFGDSDVSFASQETCKGFYSGYLFKTCWGVKLGHLHVESDKGELTADEVCTGKYMVSVINRRGIKGVARGCRGHETIRVCGERESDDQ